MMYNKLVRDKIPEIIAASGQSVSYRILVGEGYKKALEDKLDEEVIEYHESRSVEELADIVEVLHALIKANGQNRLKVFIARVKKKLRKGGLGRRVFLEDTKEHTVEAKEDTVEVKQEDVDLLDLIEDDLK